MQGTAHVAAAISLAVIIAAPRPADAAFVATMQQVGADVVVTGTGSLNVLALQNVVDINLGQTVPADVGPRRSTVNFGLDAPALLRRYGFITAPANFGPGELTITASFRSGDAIAITREYIFLDRFYDPVGTDLSASMTFQNLSFTDLGVTPGSYVWSWGSEESGTFDTFSLNILAPTPPTAVPAPAGLGVFGLALAGLMLTRRKLV